MSETSIEWTHPPGFKGATWNPVAGCRRVSPGCGKDASPSGCYAENIAVRFAQAPGKAGDRFRLVVRYGDCEKCGGTGEVKGAACPKCKGAKVTPKGWNGKYVEIPERLADPLRTKAPTCWFVNSMSDLFGEGVSNEYIAAVFGVMAATPWHTYQILTKRAERAAEWYAVMATRAQRHPMFPEIDPAVVACVAATGNLIGNTPLRSLNPRWPLPNVHIGVSVEARDYLPRLDYLRRIPAAVRMVSLEPLLEDLGAINLDGIGWVIIGSESGPNKRPCQLDWIRSLIDQCAAARVACFVKQIASDEARKAGDPKGGNPRFWPEWARVRQWPGDIR